LPTEKKNGGIQINKTRHGLHHNPSWDLEILLKRGFFGARNAKGAPNRVAVTPNTTPRHGASLIYPEANAPRYSGSSSKPPTLSNPPFFHGQ